MCRISFSKIYISNSISISFPLGCFNNNNNGNVWHSHGEQIFHNFFEFFNKMKLVLFPNFIIGWNRENAGFIIFIVWHDDLLLFLLLFFKGWKKKHSIPDINFQFDSCYFLLMCFVYFNKFFFVFFDSEDRFHGFDMAFHEEFWIVEFIDIGFNGSNECMHNNQLI